MKTNSGSGRPMMLMSSELDAEVDQREGCDPSSMAISSVMVERRSREPRPPLLHPRGIVTMIRVVTQHANDSKGFALWQFVRFAIAATYFWIGGTYLFGGNHVLTEPTLHLLENIEPGGIRTHGLILCVLAFMVASRPLFWRPPLTALTVTLFYSLLCATLIVGGWSTHKPDLAAPAWYVLVATLSFALVVTAPLTSKRWGSRGGGSGA